METATEKDTRLFRFGAVVPEEHQDLALRIASLEDLLNSRIDLHQYAASIRTIYFIPIVAEAPEAETYTTYEPENQTVEIRIPIHPDEEPLQVFIRELTAFLEQVEGDFTGFLDALREVKNILD
ncbi:hypothetical protein [Lewinella sp. LCG006]|uniref:hypothetical protein n=1 Tax=Lewinella sp. LCG006 TaxID=3231911 RepID=UPI003460DA37